MEENKNHDYSKIVTEQAAFDAEGIDMQTLDKMFENVPEKFRPFMKTSMRRAVTMSAINGPHVADWTKTDEKKWFPVWLASAKDGSSSVGLSLGVCGYGGSNALAGARHVLKSKEMTQHYAAHFRELDEDFYSNNQNKQ